MDTGKNGKIFITKRIGTLRTLHGEFRGAL